MCLYKVAWAKLCAKAKLINILNPGWALGTPVGQNEEVVPTMSALKPFKTLLPVSSIRIGEVSTVNVRL